MTLTHFLYALCLFYFIGTQLTRGQNVLPSESEIREIRSKVLYPYKKSDLLGGVTGGNSQVEKRLRFHIPYYGFSFNYTWVSLHGAVFFSDTPATLDFPLKLPVDKWPSEKDPSFIALFYSHSFAGSGSSGTQNEEYPPGLYFREYYEMGKPGEDWIMREELAMKEALRLDIQEGMIGAADFIPKHALIITWRNVTHSLIQKQISNTYQMIIVTDDIRTYIMFNYERIKWYSSVLNGGNDEGMGGKPAFVGFNAGNGTQAFEYEPYSQHNKIADLASYGQINGFPGRHMFRIDEEILQGACNYEPRVSNPKLVLSPDSGHMLGGTIVNVTGPCFNTDKTNVKFKFHDQMVTCTVKNRNMATCVTPSIFSAGYVDVVPYLDDSRFSFQTKYYVENPLVATEHVSFDDPDVLSSLDGKTLNIRWSWNNLTAEQSSQVAISLWGYREYAMKPDLIFITTLREGVPNIGRVELDLQQFELNDDGWLREFTFGLIKINATLPVVGGYPLIPYLWSRPIPLGWYFHKQWIRYYGDDWATKFCDRWNLDDRRLRNFAHQVPRCPCNREQAVADKGRFVPDFGCEKHWNPYCYGSQKILYCVRSGQSSADGAGQQCCYGTDGDLIMNVDMKEGGIPSRSHPFGFYPYDQSTTVPGLSHWYHDFSPYYVCCGWQDEMSESCYQFKWRRASQDCIGYQPPNVSAVFGDPHFITYDNHEYTFNGKGEFALTTVHHKAHDLDVQGRFEQVIDPWRMVKLPATQLTSIVASDNVSVSVEVQLRPSEARWRYHLNVIVEKMKVYFDRPAKRLQVFKGVTVYCPSDIHNQAHVIISFRSGAGVEVIESNGFMAARIYLPKTFMNLTRGLMGNWSNDKDDEFTLPEHLDRPPLPIGSLNQVIHEEFGMKWVVKDSGDPNIKGTTSLFNYENKRTSSFYTDLDFKPEYDTSPKWLDNMTMTLNDIRDVCGGEQDTTIYQCRYDFLITQNKEFAQATKLNAVDFRKMKKYELKTITTCGALATPRHGRKSTHKYVVGTEVKFECEKGYVLIGEPIRWCYPAGEWSWTEYGITRCLHEDEYSARQAGITAGIVLGVTFAAGILAGTYIVCVLNNKKYDAVYYTAESEYSARQAGITSGIVLGILIPVIIGAICLFGFIMSKRNESRSSSRESHGMTNIRSREVDVGSKTKGDTDA